MGAKIKRRDPKAIRKVYERLGESTQKEIAVGFPKEKQNAYPEGESVAEVAAQHVYGVGVPKRDFMRLARGDIANGTKPILRKFQKTEITPLLAAAGEVAKSAIQKAIVDLKDPPNAPSTIAEKGSDNPLIDTSHMLQSVTYVVRKKTA